MNEENKKEKILFQDSLVSIPEQSDVRVTTMNHIIEVQYMEKMNRHNPIIKLSKDEYCCVYGDEAGEVKKFQHSENRSGAVNSLRQTFKKLRYLINNNFIGGTDELFVTLTYAENMTDTVRLYNDFKNFIKKLKYKYKKQNISFEYLSVAEPQARGAWHLHVLFKFNKKNMYIDNSELAEIWGNGFVRINRLKNIDNIGAYLTAYLADIELDEAEAVPRNVEVVEKEVEENGKKKIKRIIKGGRLNLYPSGMNLYRKSKGIEFPERIDCRYSDLKKGVLSSAKLTYTKGIELQKYSESDQTIEHFNSIVYEQYNLKRK